MSAIACARRFGVYPAMVTDIVDPSGLGRVQVSLPWLGEGDGEAVRAWARLVTPYADDDQGLEIVPAVDTEVVVVFEGGDIRRPYVIGAPWNGREAPPFQPEAANNIRRLRTRAGSVLEFDDTDGAAKVTITMANGHEVALDATGAGEIHVRHANGSSIVLTQAGDITITANARVEVTAAMVNVHAPMSRFDGVVQCDTMIATTGVVSPSYTPGAGNVW